MPTALLEHQHELTTEDASVSLVFGTHDTGYLTTENPTIAGADGATGDVARVREDGTAFGEDFVAGKTASFEISVDSVDEADPTLAGSDLLSDFEAVWRNPDLRDNATKYAILRSKVGGRVRRAYGRPRRYDENAGPLTVKGITPVVCDFLVPDGKWYDDTESSVSISILASVVSGLIAPLTTPLVTTTDPVAAQGAIVGGKTKTWPVVTFHGPVVNPSLTFNGDMVIGLTEVLLAGQSITIDPRPWRRTVLRNDGANKSGSLTRATPPMRRMLLDPGSYAVELRGTDLTGTAWASVSWRGAYPRW